MPDNLKWLNRHTVLLEHPLVEEVVRQENLQLSTPLQRMAQQHENAEDFLAALEQEQNYKDACTFLAYDLHRRAAVWWGYLCVLDLLDELKQAPAKSVDIADIAKPRTLKVPD